MKIAAQAVHVVAEKDAGSTEKMLSILGCSTACLNVHLNEQRRYTQNETLSDSFVSSERAQGFPLCNSAVAQVHRRGLSAYVANVWAAGVTKKELHVHTYIRCISSNMLVSTGSTLPTSRRRAPVLSGWQMAATAHRSEIAVCPGIRTLVSFSKWPRTGNVSAANRCRNRRQQLTHSTIRLARSEQPSLSLVR